MSGRPEEQSDTPHATQRSRSGESLQLVLDALNMALATRLPTGIIHH